MAGRQSAAPQALAAAFVALGSPALGCGVVLPFDDLAEDTAARCANGADDDLDGLTDCQDPDCDGACRESSAATCSNCRDDDGNGEADHADPICWPRATVTAGVLVGGEARRCSSRSASSLRLAPGEAPWQWRSACHARGDCPVEHPWEPDPSGPSEPLARLEGSETCSGAGVLTTGCDYVVTPAAATGGVCWRIDAEIILGDPGAELALVIAPSVSDPPLAAATSAAVVQVARRRDAEGAPVVALSYLADGRPPQRALVPDTGSAVVVRVESRARGEGSCHDTRVAELAITLTVAGEPPLSLTRWSDTSTPLHAPIAWAADVPLHVAMQASGVGTTWIRALAIRRERFDPCGHPVPQITGDDGGAAVVLAAARGGGRVCAVGATPAAVHLERPYDPRRHHASPPDLEPELTARRTFASWRSDDRGVGSFGAGAAVDGPIRAPALEGLHVRAAELAWADEVGFEGVLLVSEEPGQDGRLIRIASDDCAAWEAETIDGLEQVAAEAAHPLLYELGPRRLVLATPAPGYAAEDDPRCCHEPECPATDRAACAADPSAGWPSRCFVAAADPVPYVKPLRSECMLYPRSDLLEAVWAEDDGWSTSRLGSLPALQRWAVGCGCLPYVVDLPPRVRPAEAHQLLERGGYRAFLVSGASGLEIVVDEETEGGDVGGPAISDGALMERPLLEPSAIEGTFDAARVAEGHLLVLGHPRSNPACPLEALLFYRGFHAHAIGDELVEWAGGAVGVVPIRFGPSTPERLARACLDLGRRECER